MWYYKNTWHSIENSIYALTAYFTLDYPVLNCKTFLGITQHLHPPFPLMWFDHWLLTKHFPKGLRKSKLPSYPNLAWTHSLNCLFIASDSWINQSWTARNPKQKKISYHSINRHKGNVKSIRFVNTVVLKQRLLDIALAKTGWLRTSREIQFRVCNHGSHIQAPEAKEGEHSHRTEKEIGRVIVNKETIAFHWLSCFQERKGSLIFLLGSAIIPGPESFPFYFILFFLHLPLLIKIFLWKNHWSRVRLSSLRIFCPQGQKGHFLGVMSHFGGKVDRLETYWVHICVRKGVGEKTFRNFYLFYFKRLFNCTSR